MQRVHDQADQPLSQMKFAAVAVGIGQDEAPHQLHAGVFHADAGNAPAMLHLAWHCHLQNDSPQDSYLWVQPPFDELRLRQVAAMCRRIFRKNAANGLPYGFGVPNDAFDPQTGEYLINGSQYGLTCASFVLAVFHVTGLPLVDYSTWPQGRPDDRPWQQFIIASLSQNPTNQVHAERISEDIGAVRFHPFEVAASAAKAQVQFPARFEDVDQLGTDIRVRIACDHINYLFARLAIVPQNSDDTSPLVTSRQAAIDLAFRLAETHRLTPFEVRMKDSSATLLAFRHPYERQLTLEIESDPTGTFTASVLNNGSALMSGRFPDDEEKVLTTFLTGNLNR